MESKSSSKTPNFLEALNAADSIFGASDIFAPPSNNYSFGMEQKEPTEDILTSLRAQPIQKPESQYFAKLPGTRMGMKSSSSFADLANSFDQLNPSFSRTPGVDPL
jgi:hypothetical protein